MKHLLELKEKMKSKMPEFLRQDAHKKVKLEKVWRKPKGRHSKMRQCWKGHPKMVSIGYSTPKAVRDLHYTGLKPIMVYNMGDLNNIKKEEGIILSGAIGAKKKLLILRRMQELKLNLLNLNIEDYIKRIQEKLAKKKEYKKERLVKKKKTKKETTKKPEEKVEENPEEKEKKAKEEKKKVLEKRQ